MQGLADHRFGFLEVLALLGVKVSQVVVGPGIVRVTLEKQLELGLALGIVAPVHVNDRQALAYHRHDLVVVGIAFQHVFKELDRFVVVIGHG